MRNLKVSGSNNAIESSLSMTAPDTRNNIENKENVFLIGLNFQNNPEIINAGGTKQNSKIPILMLKIDTNKIMASQSSDESSDDGYSGERNDEDNSINQNNNDSGPVTEIYTYDYQEPEKKLPHENLSFREMQVMKLIALGKTRKEIADELFLSISTINTYRARILEKMDMKNNADIMRYSFKHKIVE